MADPVYRAMIDDSILASPAPEDDLVEAVALKMAEFSDWNHRRDAARAVIPIAQAPIIAERDAALAERDRQYDENVSLISKLAAAEAALEHAKRLSCGQIGDNQYICKQRLDATYGFLVRYHEALATEKPE